MVTGFTKIRQARSATTASQSVSASGSRSAAWAGRRPATQLGAPLVHGDGRNHHRRCRCRGCPSARGRPGPCRLRRRPCSAMKAVVALSPRMCRSPFGTGSKAWASTPAACRAPARPLPDIRRSRARRTSAQQHRHLSELTAHAPSNLAIPPVCPAPADAAGTHGDHHVAILRRGQDRPGMSSMFSTNTGSILPATRSARQERPSAATMGGSPAAYTSPSSSASTVDRTFTKSFETIPRAREAVGWKASTRRLSGKARGRRRWWPPSRPGDGRSRR